MIIHNCKLKEICDPDIRALEYNDFLIVLRHNQGLSAGNMPHIAIVFQQVGNDCRRVKELSNIAETYTLKEINQEFKKGWWSK